MKFFKHTTNIDFVGKRKIFFAISAAIMIFGFLAVALVGVKYSIEFEGGVEIAVSISGQPKTEQIREAVSEAGFDGGEIKSFGSQNQYLIRVPDQPNASDRILTELREQFPNQEVTTLKIDKIGAKIGKELQFDAMLALFLAIIAILIYVAFRFEFVFGLGAIIALAHDVLFAIIVIVIVNKLGIMNLEINQNILAALLTVIGFSINDTVVIFDRIRENRELHKGMNFVKMINLSINETLSRTIITSLTVFFTLLVIVVAGGPVLQGFAFTMLIGVISGTYSTIYIASSFVIWYLEKVKKVDLNKGVAGKPKVGTSAA